MYKKSIKTIQFLLTLLWNSIKKLNLHKLPFLLFIIAATFMYFFGQITCADDAFASLMQTTKSGNNQIKIFYQNQQIEEYDSKLQMVMKEKVIHIERHCESLFKCFPSGILTPFSWILGGVAVRHEYVIVQTTNHVVTIELKLNQEKNHYIQIHLNDYDKGFMEFLLKERKWDRQLTQLNHEEIGNLQFSQLFDFLGKVLICWGGINMFKKGKYEVLFKNCKSLTKSICYFAMKDCNVNQVMQSILGLYTDHFCDFIERKEVQWILDITYNQTISSVAKMRAIMHNLLELRNRIEEPELLNWNII